MGVDGADLQFDKASVAKFTQGVGATIDGLGDLGGATGSVLGKGFSELAMTGMEAGHHGLSVDFEDFCERWEWGVRALVGDASALASRLGLAAGTQWEHDQYVEGTLKVGVNSVMGGRTVLTEGEGGRRSQAIIDASGVSEDQWNQALDNTFGPSPEERAQQAQQQGESGGN